MGYKRRGPRRKSKDQKKIIKKDTDMQILNFDYENDGKKVTPPWVKKLLIALGSIAGAIVVIYLGITIFFMGHFYYNTKINGVDFSMKTASTVKNYMKTEVKGYSLTIHQKDGVKDTIKGSDIDLAYKENKEINNALKKQNAFLWPSAFFSDRNLDVKIGVNYDKETLAAKIQSLQCVTNPNPTAPVSSYPKFDGNSFVVEPEVSGTQVDQAALSKKIEAFISGFQSVIDLEKEQAYLQPAFTAKSSEVQAACDEMNTYCKASITYDLVSTTEVVDKAVISGWITYDDKMAVTFNEDAVKAYMKEFGKKYDTLGKTRSITSPTGKTVDVSGGTYGWSIDEAAETSALIANVKNGDVVTREPAYAKTAATHAAQDWGTTYVEVDLSAQHMWYIVDGASVFDTAVVTGQPIPEKETPPGVYDIMEKLRGKVLTGEMLPSTGKPAYKTRVEYWARITGTGIGFHDATWQTAFGGELYKTSAGSHGCINMSLSDVATFYDMITTGTPVVVHY